MVLIPDSILDVVLNVVGTQNKNRTLVFVFLFYLKAIFQKYKTRPNIFLRFSKFKSTRNRVEH